MRVDPKGGKKKTSNLDSETDNENEGRSILFSFCGNNLIGVNAMCSGRSGYSWYFSRMDIPITQFS